MIRFLLAICIFILSNAAYCQSVKSLTLYTEDLPPYNMVENDQVTGMSSDIITAALNRVPFRFTLRLVAWQRAFHEAQTERGVCVYSTVRTPEREELFQWVGPIGRDSLAVFVTPDSPIQAHALSDLKNYRTVISPGDYAEPQLRAGGFRIVPAPNEKQLDMLTAGRVDFWVTNRSEAQFASKRTGTPLKELFAYDDFELYLACNRTVPAELIEKMNDAVKQVFDSGEAARIVAKYTAP
jgi:polar amino acid transport system substrate-binding protein